MAKSRLTDTGVGSPTG